jgi:TRAP-type uncharacterized transport system substrate-binding protein
MQLSSRTRATVLPRRCAARPFRPPPQGLRPVALAVLLLPLIAWLAGQVALAETSSAAQRSAISLQQVLQKKHNDNALMILGGYPGTTYFGIAHDIAAALGGGDGLRLVAVDAAGGTESLRDLLLLRGIDLALVPANALVYANAAGIFGPGLQDRMTYVTQIYGEEVHILVGPGTGSFENLRGKKIAVPPEDGNAEFTIRDLLRRLHIEAEVVKVAATDAVDQVRAGTLAALVLMGGKPMRFVAGLPKDGSLRLLPLPSSQALEDAYSLAGLRSDDYPTLIPGGQTIDTVSVNAVMVANNTAKWDDSSRRVARFVPAFFGALSELAGPERHPKWGEVNLAAPLVGWSRTAAAKDWLDQTKLEQTASVQKVFDDFLRASSTPGTPPPSPKERKQLFEEFVKWTRNSMGSPNPAVRP